VDQTVPILDQTQIIDALQVRFRL